MFTKINCTKAKFLHRLNFDLNHQFLCFVGQWFYNWAPKSSLQSSIHDWPTSLFADVDLHAWTQNNLLQQRLKY